jgi:hypothetical protein
LTIWDAAGLGSALKADAVAVDRACARDGQEKEVEVLERGGHARQPATGCPSFSASGLRFGVRSRVVPADPAGDLSVERGEREPSGILRSTSTVGREVPRKRRQQFGGDRSEDPLDLAAALWDAGPGEREPDVEVGGDLLEVLAVKSEPWSV